MNQNSMELVVDSDFTSPWALSAYAALTHKGLEFSVRSVDLAQRQNREPEFADPSLTARVPLLRHGDFFLTESSAIAEYLEDLLPPPDAPSLYPQDTRARARARQLQAWLRSDLQPIRNERPTEVIFVSPSHKPLSARASACARHLCEVAGKLLPPGDANLFGKWSIADLDLAVMLMRLVVNDDPVPQRLVEYVEAQWQIDPVQRWLRARSA
ncbi:glutathione transferase [Paraburkholderia sediminicola]|uniref:Glutathione transferase n=1 Tax=Paraburkholderia rhynchosiae TaxID=487049 RepID=A0ACC7NFJ2_9BURK